ncbi:MAG: superinfection immunity protein [Pseudomonadota bacterium]
MRSSQSSRLGSAGTWQKRGWSIVTVALPLLLLSAGPTMAQEHSSKGDWGLIIFLSIALAVYLIPTIVAFRRRHPNRWIIGALNLVLGGTGIVWLGCLVWACGAVHKSADPQGSDGGESGLNIFANDVSKVEIVGNDKLAPQNQIDQLERLKRLLDTGVITNEQFEALKAKVVGTS